MPIIFERTNTKPKEGYTLPEGMEELDTTGGTVYVVEYTYFNQYFKRLAIAKEEQDSFYNSEGRVEYRPVTRFWLVGLQHSVDIVLASPNVLKKFEGPGDLTEDWVEDIEGLSNYVGGDVLGFVEKERVRVLDRGFLSNPDEDLFNLICGQNRSMDYSRVLRTLSCYGLRRSTKFEGKLTLYKTMDDRSRDREVAMKPGKALRWIYPDLSDKEVANFVNAFNKRYGKRNLHLKTGSERSDFKHAYTFERVGYQDPTTTSSRKAIAHSCMHGDFGPTHPAEVYGSGEFEIAWVEGDSGHIAGRVVIWKGENGDTHIPGPMYGACEHSLNILSEYLSSLGVDPSDAGQDSWSGAKLLHIVENGMVVAPYSDMEQEASIDGDYLVLGGGHDLELVRTDGVADGGGGCTCAWCEETRFNPDEEGIYVEDVGEVCYHCRDEFVWDEIGDRFINVDNSIMYYAKWYGGRIDSLYTHMDSEQIVYCECVDEYWEECYVTYSEKMEEYVPTHLMEDFSDYFEDDDDDNNNEEAA